MTTKQTTQRITTYDKYASITATSSTQTTDLLQSTAMKTKGDIIANDQITGNIISTNTVNDEYIIPYC